MIPMTREWDEYMAQALRAEDCPVAARLVGDFSTLFGAIALPINPLKDATPAPVYGVANREGAEL
jgi:hypothetical protein